MSIEEPESALDGLSQTWNFQVGIYTVLIEFVKHQVFWLVWYFDRLVNLLKGLRLIHVVYRDHIFFAIFRLSLFIYNTARKPTEWRIYIKITCKRLVRLKNYVQNIFIIHIYLWYRSWLSFLHMYSLTDFNFCRC